MRFLIIFTFSFNFFLLFLVSDHFRYEGDFDTKGVIHYLGLSAGVSMLLNPAQVPSSGVKVTYYDGTGRGDPENCCDVEIIIVCTLYGIT